MLASFSHCQHENAAAAQVPADAEVPLRMIDLHVLKSGLAEKFGDLIQAVAALVDHDVGSMPNAV
jgi:hypothetical protein